MHLLRGQADWLALTRGSSHHRPWNLGLPWSATGHSPHERNQIHPSVASCVGAPFQHCPSVPFHLQIHPCPSWLPAGASSCCYGNEQEYNINESSSFYRNKKGVH